MITSLLIANRGEIAARIIRTCRRLNIRAVAVYSEADRHAPHVALADEAYGIGPAESAASYLNADAIIAVALRAKVDAIHPGYGFLSESDALISLCEKQNIIFVGPNREAIRLMGSKLEAKRIAQQAGVPVIPGYHGEDQSETTLALEADKVGYPLMIKASAGGGGKGMRQVDSAAEFAAALQDAKREALASFGDDAMLLEKLVTAPRHIEVQVAADKTGTTVHLYERECSIQRNHQKVIEEAPAAFISDQQREALYASALTLTKAINYDSLGTIEFLLDNNSGDIYFLEMNTRLQVEHPVTEYITGLDLVEWQIRIAAGEALPLSQDQIPCDGWAIEARINAEDPANNYQPQTGLITHYSEPGSLPGNEPNGKAAVRIDSAVQAGSEITPYYDSMIAKVIAGGDDRAQAKSRLITALNQFRITGPRTNLVFVTDILRRPEFIDQALSTGFLAQCFPGGWTPAPVSADAPLLAAIAYTVNREHPTDAALSSPWQTLGSFRLLERAGITAQNRIALEDESGQQHLITVSRSGDTYHAKAHSSESSHEISSEINHEISATATGLASGAYLIEIEDAELGAHTHTLTLQSEGGLLIISSGDNIQRWRLLDEHQLALDTTADQTSGDHRVTASLPGQVVEVCCKVGDSVTAGDTVAVLDSMKLLHKLSAQTDGTVQDIFCAVGDNVENGALLIELKPNT
ncbi:MAG: biotin/lipoyl-binding protein [Porticoccaceae bacterium]|nr:biotin/lipoyl-binding protein [Porticoccaceae bacterium]